MDRPGLPETPDDVDDAEHHFQGPGTLDRALALVRHLRAECPWDAEQTAESLIPHLLEETHEVVDAIREGDSRELEGELGDLLLNLAFQIVVAEEDGSMDADSVYGRLEAKMIARHPHVFGDAEHRDWEQSKAAERSRDEGVLSGLAGGLDPLTKAYRIQERVAGVGFDWEDHRGAMAKVREELGEVEEELSQVGREPAGREAPPGPLDAERGQGELETSGGAATDELEASEDTTAEGLEASEDTTAEGLEASEDTTAEELETSEGAAAEAPGERRSGSAGDPRDGIVEEIGDLLFAAVNLSRLAGVHPTTALARANAKFRRRFEGLEAVARERDIDLPSAGLEVLDGIWEELKGEARPSGAAERDDDEYGGPTGAAGDRGRGEVGDRGRGGAGDR